MNGCKSLSSLFVVHISDTAGVVLYLNLNFCNVIISNAGLVTLHVWTYYLRLHNARLSPVMAFNSVLTIKMRKFGLSFNSCNRFAIQCGTIDQSKRIIVQRLYVKGFYYGIAQCLYIKEFFTSG